MNEIVSFTKVTLSRPARVCPRRSDKSSVAKARSYTFVSSPLPLAKDRTIHTLSRGMMARNEPIHGLEGNRTSFIVVGVLTDKNQGLTELDITENPLQVRSAICFRVSSSKKTRTEIGMKISSAFNPSSDRAPTGQKEV